MRQLAAVSPLFFSACLITNVVVGNGTVTTEARDVGAFKTLSASAAITAHATTGPRSVTVRTDQNLQAYVETVVVGDRLEARVKAGYGIDPTALEVTIVNDALEGVDASGASTVTGAATSVPDFVVTASGASSVTVTGIASTSIHLDASGASHVTLSGAATSASLVVAGASMVDAKAVPLGSADLEVSGASELTASVASSLTGSISGASRAVITGSPTSTVSTSGGSTLTTGAP